jgi:hypothetical protein
MGEREVAGEKEERAKVAAGGEVVDGATSLGPVAVRVMDWQGSAGNGPVANHLAASGNGSGYGGSGYPANPTAYGTMAGPAGNGTMAGQAGNGPVAGGGSGYAANPGAYVPSAELVGSAVEKVKQIVESGDPRLVNQLDQAELAVATVEQRLAMIRILIQKGNTLEQFNLMVLWDSFGAGLRAVAESNAADWRASFQVAPAAMRQGRNVSGVRKVFYQDVEDLARRYLDQNEQFCRDEFAKLGLSQDGDVTTGPPTAMQDRERQDLRNSATALAANQEALAALRRVSVGYTGADITTYGNLLAKGDPVAFDPANAPTIGPDSNDRTMRPWAEVKQQYDRLSLLIRARTMANPALFPLVADHQSDPSKTKIVSTGSEADSLRTAGDGLKAVLANIAKTRPLVGVLSHDLEPLQGQLLAGTQVVAPDRNWANSGFYSAIAGDLADQNRPGPWWAELAKSIGIATAEAAAYVVAGLATGGTAIAIGLGGKAAVDLTLAKGKADVMRSAYGATTSEESALLTDGQVNEAEAAVIETAVFGLLDVVAAGAGARTALRGITQFEKVATERAAKATQAAERLLAKDASDEAAKAAAASELAAVQADAEAAAKAARDAEAAAKAAPPEESARAYAAASSARKASDEAAVAAVDLWKYVEGRHTGAEPVKNSYGLGSEASYKSSLTRAKTLLKGWAAMSVEERIEKLVEFGNQAMRAQGLPPFQGPVGQVLRETSNAEFMYRSWSLNLHKSMIDGTFSMEKAAGIVYHEATHAEDFVNVARLKLGQGWSPSRISGELGIHDVAIENAVGKRGLTAAHEEYGRTKKIYDSMFGLDSLARGVTLDQLEIAGRELTLAQENADLLRVPTLKKIRTGVSKEEVEAASREVALKAKAYQEAHRAYVLLPEETQAHGTQEALLRAFNRDSFGPWLKGYLAVVGGLVSVVVAELLAQVLEDMSKPAK